MSLGEPRVSILLAAFRPTHLTAAIESVRAQDFSDYELLVLDDSADPLVAAAVAGMNDERIRLLRSDGHLGVARNHDRGLRMAKGELIAIINHDDIWEPQLLSTLVHAIDGCHDAVVAFSDHTVIDDHGVVDAEASARTSAHWGRSALPPGPHRPFHRLAVVDKALPMAQCAVWRRAAVPTIPDWVGDQYDYWLAIALALTGGAAVYVPMQLARFRIHGGNLGGNRGLRRRLQRLTFQRHLRSEPGLADFEPLLAREHRNALLSVAKWPVEVLVPPWLLRRFR